MFARKVSMNLKPNSVKEFSQKMEKDILPLLRKQNGFRDELSFVSTSGTKAFAISIWDKAENAEVYSRTGYAEVTKLLAGIIEGTPQVGTYELANSTLHEIAAAATA